MEPSSAVGEDGLPIYARFRPCQEPFIPKSRFQRHILQNDGRLGTVEWVPPGVKLPARLGSTLAGDTEGHFGTTKLHVVDRVPPNEARNPPRTAVRIDDETQFFVSVYARFQLIDSSR